MKRSVEAKHPDNEIVGGVSDRDQAVYNQTIPRTSAEYEDIGRAVATLRAHGIESKRLKEAEGNLDRIMLGVTQDFGYGVTYKEIMAEVDQAQKALEGSTSILKLEEVERLRTALDRRNNFIDGLWKFLRGARLSVESGFLRAKIGAVIGEDVESWEAVEGMHDIADGTQPASKYSGYETTLREKWGAGIVDLAGYWATLSAESLKLLRQGQTTELASAGDAGEAGN